MRILPILLATFCFAHAASASGVLLPITVGNDAEYGPTSTIAFLKIQTDLEIEDAE